MKYHSKYSDQKVIHIKNTDELFIYRTCKATCLTYGVTVREEDYSKWLYGTIPAQEIFESLGSEEREFLISNTTPDEWETLLWENDTYEIENC